MGRFGEKKKQNFNGFVVLCLSNNGNGYVVLCLKITNNIFFQVLRNILISRHNWNNLGQALASLRRKNW